MGATTLPSFAEFKQLPAEPGKLELLDQPGSESFEGAPALAVEVVSESNTAEAMNRKVKTYLANGGIEVWVVYPNTRCVWVFRKGHAEEFRSLLRCTAMVDLQFDFDWVFAL
ncbi:MAG TPA: Uma2 family endonuclease [Candidatus Acidoferrales bacterium]|jgi:Uma2 family endonuclease|nr:Uma2 family endonuclease [Candidatus Acidoferrales bacterium]